MPTRYYTLAVWCPLYDSWGSLITSERQELVERLAERMTEIIAVQVTTIETETGEDEQIVPQLLKLRRPKLRSVDDPADDGFLGYSVFDELE